MPTEIKPNGAPGFTPGDMINIVITTAVACGLVAAVWIANAFWG